MEPCTRIYPAHIMLLPTQLCRQGDRSPVSFATQKFTFQIPLTPCITSIGSFASQAKQPLLSEEEANTICLVPIRCSEQCSQSSTPEHSWNCWSCRERKPSQSVPRAGLDPPCAPEELWDGERSTWKRSVDRSSSWKAHLSCQQAPFLGAAAAKRRQIRKTEA